MIKTTEVKLTDLSGIQCRFFTADIPELKHLPTLVIEFTGDCGYGSGSNSDASFMEGMIAAGFRAWDPACYILDLRKLKYEWGDMMTSLFDPPHEMISLTKEEIEFPFAVVVSDLNRVGLTSLIKDEMDADPDKLIFSSLEEASRRVIELARKTYEV